jgi:hypothetical protein
VRQLAAVLLSCTLFSVVLLTSSPSEAYAQGYDVSGQAVVEDAQSYIGSPYGWGMDCSGFTSMVFADLGVYLPDSPDAQYAYGTPSYGEAGDLVFFDEAGYGHLARRNSNRLRDGDPRLDVLRGCRGDTHRIHPRLRGCRRRVLVRRGLGPLCMYFSTSACQIVGFALG